MSAPAGFDERFERGIAEFNAGHFFEAHEVWEELWGEEVGAAKRFLQGLVQAAAGLHKAEIGVTSGARKLLTTSLRILDDFPPDAFGIDLEALRSVLRGELACPGSPGVARIVPRGGGE